MNDYTSHRSTTPPLQARQQPAKSDQQLLDEAKHALNKYPPNKNYHISQRLVAIVTRELDKVLTRNGRLAFLSYMYDRKVSTTKLNEPEQGVYRMNMETAEKELETLIKPAVTEGLEPHEHFGLLVWGQPAQLVENAPWQVNRCVRETAEAFQRTGLGQTTFLEAVEATEPIAKPKKARKSRRKS